MIKLVLGLTLFISSLAFAGGTTGGGGLGVNLETLSLISLTIDQLPKAFADRDDLRRASIRLGETGVETSALRVDGEKIQVRKIRDSIVDENISKEILPQ